MVNNLYIVTPRGFCAGVDRAIDIVNKALEIYGSQSTVIMKSFTMIG